MKIIARNKQFNQTIDTSELSLLHRMTNANEVSDDMTMGPVSLNVYYNYFYKLVEIFGDEFANDPMMDLSVVHELHSMLQCNTYGIKQGNSHASIAIVIIYIYNNDILFYLFPRIFILQIAIRDYQAYIFSGHCSIMHVILMLISSAILKILVGRCFL
jgi:hypothetical protein